MKAAEFAISRKGNPCIAKISKDALIDEGFGIAQSLEAIFRSPLVLSKYPMNILSFSVTTMSVYVPTMLLFWGSSIVKVLQFDHVA